MGIVLGKPENYGKLSASAVRRIANEEISAKKKRNTRNKPNTRNKRPKPEKEEEEEEMPDEFKDAMREAGLDPDDPKDVKEFLKSLNQDGGRRKRQTRNKRRSY